MGTVVVAAGLAALLLPGPGLVAPAFAGVPGPGPAGQGTAAAQAAAPAQGSRPPVPPNFDVSQRPGNEGENTIAANPTNPRNVVAMTCPVGRKNLDGLFIAVSFECRNAKGQGGRGCARPDSYTQFWATYSTDGGTRFVPDFRVSQGTSNAKDTHSFFDYGDYTQVAFQSHLFYPAWSDNSDSTGTNPDGTLHQVDLYAARVRIP